MLRIVILEPLMSRDLADGMNVVPPAYGLALRSGRSWQRSGRRAHREADDNRGSSASHMPVKVLGL